MPTWADHEKALMRSQKGPFAGVALSVAPINFLTRIDPSLFRVLPSPSSSPRTLSLRFCRCGRPLDPVAVDFWLRARLLGFAGRFAGRLRVAVNVMVRDMDLAIPNAKEVLIDGLPLYGGAQLVIDTTLVSAIRGIMLAQARRRKERTFLELVGRRSRARLVVSAGEVGGEVVGGDTADAPLHLGTRESPL